MLHKLKSFHPTAILVAVLLFNPLTIALAEDDDSIAIVGNNELPASQFIIPWKNPDSPKPTGRPVNSLINRSLEPLDPDIFDRKMTFYNRAHKSD
ncbi:MAG: hypothetical protein V3W04_05180 [Gammaproteobacteria bacterium]